MDTVVYKGFEFSPIYQSPFSTLFYNNEIQLALCTAQVEYIPIDHFKKVFLDIFGLLENYPMRSFLFDKRKLRTFHQPSMEWYFAEWKQKMKAFGLSQHYKILPDLEWFVQSVNAGKQEILSKYGESLLNGIDIKYVDSVENVIEQLKS